MSSNRRQGKECRKWYKLFNSSALESYELTCPWWNCQKCNIKSLKDLGHVRKNKKCRVCRRNVPLANMEIHVVQVRRQGVGT